VDAYSATADRSKRSAPVTSCGSGPAKGHWHGASPTTAMTHIAIAEMLDGKAVEWMEHVTDEKHGR
jgi:hypothetical protein